MLTESTSLAADPPPADAGLRCPECDYNLTGLTEARCPECGTPFDVAKLQRRGRPTIAFERARARRKLSAFVLTWATVMFAPWIFARQAIAQISGRHALFFGGVCFASAFLALFFGADLPIILAWLATACIYLVFQTMLFLILDRTGWHELRASARFWLLIGGYTSAVMMTEFDYGPPFVFLSDLVALVTGGSLSWYSEMYKLSLRSVVCWTQMALWIAGLACCLYMRFRHRSRGATSAWIMSLIAALAVLLLYAAVLEHIGQPIAERFYNWL